MDQIGVQNLTSTGHGFEVFGAIPIKQAAKQSALSYTERAKEKPAIVLISVVLAANREYNKVVGPNLKKIETLYPDLKTFRQLEEMVSLKSEEEFYLFWGHKDQKKYATLKKLLLKIEELRKVYPLAKDDYDLMNQWASHADLLNNKQDIIGSISNIGVATFQHLRMAYGIDTVKPDQRVKEVLSDKLNLLGLSDKKAIKAVEQIALIAGAKAIVIDQVFVKYGSSYYNKKIKKACPMIRPTAFD